ncbi:ATP-binding protein [Horticoccus luteus]|uniref:ATP-binding protein n=1 Tax=Horticoccus luteus TaxID=2862869 RepID=A0A8F9XMP5_9BACT|nr:ATP-binding protein [Horticoccus luteus]QYM80259.1 ATP-binding protein [Horticoccus luteus]
MPAHPDTPAPEGAQPQIPAPISTPGENAQAVERALANQGNTVRASWRFSLDTLRANIQYMEPEAKELLVWAFTWCIDQEHSIDFASFCDRVGYNTNTIYKLYSGKYKHPETGRLMDAPEKLVKAIRAFRKLEISRAKMGAKRFFHTATAKRVYWAIEQARKSGRPVMIFGGSQLGKTEACLQNTIDFNHGKTILVEVEAVNGLKGLLQAIAVKLGISPNANTPELIKRIKAGLTSDMVLILDEVHLLANVYRKGSFFACMEQIRRLWDAKKFGLVLTFTELGYDMVAKERKRELMQIFRRGVLRVNLGSKPLVEDVRVIVEGYGFEWAERHDQIVLGSGLADTPWAALKQLCEEEGLTAIMERIRMAHELAADEQRDQPAWRDFIVAHFAIAQQALPPKTGWDKAEGRAA